MSDDAARSGQGDTPWSPPEPQPHAPEPPPAPAGVAPQAFAPPDLPQAPYDQTPYGQAPYGQVVPPPGAYPPPLQGQQATGVGQRMSRPWTFSGAMGLIGLTLVCMLGNAVLILTKGRDLLSDTVDDILGPGIPEGIHEAALDEAYDTMSARASIALFLGVIVLGFAIPTLFRLHWSRIVVTCVLPLLLLVAVRNVTDSIPTVMRALDGVALASGLLSIVLVWLGPSNRYFRSRKGASAPVPPYPGWA